MSLLDAEDLIERRTAQDRGPVLVAYWTQTDREEAGVDEDGWVWAHPARVCEVAVRLRFGTLARAARASADDWNEHESRCAACGQFINWPVSEPARRRRTR